MKKLHIPKDFNTFKYKLPSENPAHYAENALRLLQKLEKLNPKLLPYFLASNTVMTLSGVRALDTYISFDDLTDAEVGEVTRFLESQHITLFPHWSEYDDSDQDTYSLIHHAAVKQIHKQYKLEAWIEPHQPFTYDRLLGWTYLVENDIFTAIEKGKLPKAWATNRWTAHNIRFGILLGYPGEAIASFCWSDAVHELTGEETELVWATITDSKKYDAAVPVYNILPEQSTNPNIRAHQKLWSNILTQVYESDWHQQINIPTRV